jgi:hypothetical protein
MSVLNSKINSYALERGIEFNETVSTSPTRTGTNPEKNYSTNGSIAFSSDGPTSDSGSWELTRNGLTNFRSDNVENTEILGIEDGDFSLGIWFKVDALPQLTSEQSLNVLLISNPGIAAQIAVVGSENATLASRIRFVVLGQVVYSEDPIEANKWYYAAILSSSSGISAYINGEKEFDLAAQSSQQPTRIAFGQLVSRTDGVKFNISNFYLTTSQEVDEQAIQEIYQSSLEIDSVNQVTPMICSGILENPQVLVKTNILVQVSNMSALAEFKVAEILIPDFVIFAEPSTAFSDFAQNITVDGQRSLNINAATMTASGFFPDLIIIKSGTGNIFESEKMVASATFETPRVLLPFFASADFPNPTLNVDPSYFVLITQKNPYVYWDAGPTNFKNDGSWSGLTATEPTSGLAKNVPITDGNLGSISLGTSWTLESNRSMNIDPSQESASQGITNSTLFQNIRNTHDWSVSMWVNERSPSTVSDVVYIFGGIRIKNYKRRLPGSTIRSRHQLEVLIPNVSNTGYPSGSVPFPNVNANGIAITPGTFCWYPGSSTISEQYSGVDYLNKNNWHYLTLSEIDQGDNTSKIQLLIDGQIIFNYTVEKSFAGTSSGGSGRIDIVSENLSNTTLAFDHIVVDSRSLSAAESLEQYLFVDEISPNVNFSAEPFSASSFMSDSQVLVSFSIVLPVNGTPSFAIFAQPLITARKNITIPINLFSASAESIDPVFFGTPDYTDLSLPMIASAQEIGGYHLSRVYSEYINENTNPYRYLTFDNEDPLKDFGTDEEYDVPLAIINGTIVEPNLGINNRSYLTLNSSSDLDGLYLMESEHNDTWGTVGGNYHSSFWINASDEESSSGLKILWNLNSALDNQHIILYQYENKLYLNFNNKSGTFIEQGTEGSFNLTDKNRHFVVVNFEQDGTDNLAKLYVDGFEAMEMNLGSYTVETLNSENFLDPDDAENNKPRLSLGGLITPLEEVSLPTEPNSLSAYIDEVYWSKRSTDAQEVLFLFNLMPDKVNVNYFHTVAIANAEKIEISEVSTETTFTHESFAAASSMVDPNIVAELNLIIEINEAFESTAEFPLAKRADEVDFQAVFMIASASMSDAQGGVSFFATSMSATHTMMDPLVNSINLSTQVLSPYIRYLIVTRQESLLPKKEFN